MAQFARPDGDVTNTGTNGFGAIDESSASDADFWWGDNNVAEELEVSLSNVTDPNSSSGHTVRFRIGKTNAGTLDGGGNAVTVTCRLMQGTTQIATSGAITATGTWTTQSFTLSSAEADAITDYNDLRLEFVTSASGGSPANRRGGAVSWAELEVPDVTANVNGTATVSGGGAASASSQKNGASSPTISGGARGNLCTNPGFETDTSGWITSQATLTRDTTEAYAGAASGKVVTNGVVDDNRAEFRTPAGTNPGAGTIMGARARVKAAVGQDYSVSVIARDSGGLYIGTFSPVFYVGTGAWQEVQYQRAATAEASSVAFSIGGLDLGTEVVTLFVDAVELLLNPFVATKAASGTASISGGGALVASGGELADSVFFDGVDDALVFNLGGAAIPAGPITLAIVMKDNAWSEGNFDALLVAENGVDDRWWTAYMYGFGSNVFMLGTTAGDQTGPTAVDLGTLGLTGQWVILVVTKADGAVAPRFHRFDETNGWDHQDAAGTLANGTTPPSDAKLRVGHDTLFGSPADVNMLIFGIKDAVMSDAEIEALADGYQAWVDAGFVEGVRLDAVSGLTSFADGGTMALESASGAIVDAGDGPAWWDDELVGGNVDGTAAVSGGGTVSGTGQKDTSAAAVLSGDGTISATSQKNVADAVAISGGGAVTASGAEGAARAATLSGGGAITASGTKDAPATATVSGGGAIAGAETTDRSVVALTSGGGALSGVATTDRSVTTILSGGGTLVVVAGKTFSIDAAVSGGGELSATGQLNASSSPTVSGGGALSSSASKNANATAGISGGGELSGTGQAASEGEGSATLSGGGTLSATGQKDSSSTTTLSGGGAVAAVTSKGGLAAPTISGGGSPTATTSRGASGAPILSGGGVASGAGEKAAAGTPLVSGGGSQTAIAGKDAFVSATLTGGGELVASGTAAFGTTGTLVLSGGGVVAALGASERLSVASLAGGGSPSFSTEGAHASVVVLAGGGELTASGVEGEAPAVAQIDETSTSGLKGVTRTA